MSLFRYVLTDSEFQVKVGSIAVRKIPYSDISGVESRYTFWNEHWCNPLPLKFVTIRRRSGIIRNFVINPPDPEKFSEELRARIMS